MPGEMTGCDRLVHVFQPGRGGGYCRREDRIETLRGGEIGGGGVNPVAAEAQIIR